MTLRVDSAPAPVLSRVPSAPIPGSETLTRAWRTIPALVGIVALGAVLRLSLLSGFRFHPDEALYGTWARFVATGQDPMLVEHLVDKPPLFIYVLASLFGMLGASEEIARLPNQVAGAAALLLVYGIGLELYHTRRVALIAAAVLALSPLSILFAPTAFTDPLMTTLLLAAIWWGLRGKYLLCGLGFGLALATKQDALFFTPLLLLLPFINRNAPPHTLTFRHMGKRLFRFALGLSAPVLLVVSWGALRPQPDFLQASLANYGGFNLAAPEAYASRALEWLPLLRTLSSNWLLLLMILTVPLLVVRERRSVDVILVSVALGWLALHIVFMIPAWDRYVLPLSPLCALLVARAIAHVYGRLPSRATKLGSAVIAAFLLILPAQAALRDEIHVGRDYNVHAGVEQVGQWFWEIDTTATILYDHDLSWELDYYTFGRELDRRWFVDAEQLSQDAAHMPLARRFVAVAEWESTAGELAAALAREHLGLEPVFVARRPDGSAAVTVYMILPESVAVSGQAHTMRSDVQPSSR